MGSRRAVEDSGDAAGKCVVAVDGLSHQEPLNLSQPLVDRPRASRPSAAQRRIALSGGERLVAVWRIDQLAVIPQSPDRSLRQRIGRQPMGVTAMWLNRQAPGGLVKLASLRIADHAMTPPAATAKIAIIRTGHDFFDWSRNGVHGKCSNAVFD